MYFSQKTLTDENSIIFSFNYIYTFTSDTEQKQRKKNSNILNSSLY